mmetsp:Transcript_15527/g.46888  ORF Transcript_15527/g.46888 Transcript_15527/m.46888 type:complete len:202 (+) Transcript_15527:482-1087(+)
MPKLADVEDPAPTAQAALPAAAGEQPAHGAAPAGDDSKPSPFAAAGPQSGVPAPGAGAGVKAEPPGAGDITADARGGDGEDGSQPSAIPWTGYELTNGVQTLLDQNKLLLNEINANHEDRTPEALARNDLLIRELNSNIAKVVQLYRDMDASFEAYSNASSAIKTGGAAPMRPADQGGQAAEAGSLAASVVPSSQPQPMVT